MNFNVISPVINNYNCINFNRRYEMKMDRKAFNDMKSEIAKGMGRIKFADAEMTPEQQMEADKMAGETMADFGLEMEDVAAVENEVEKAGTDIDADIEYLMKLKEDPARTEAEIKDIDAAIEKANNAKQELETLKTLIADLKTKFPEAPVAEVAPEMTATV